MSPADPQENGHEAVLTDRPRRKRRPNASGFSKTDCHTCVQGSTTCDRLLPKCEACLEKGEICGGYVVALKWGEAVSVSEVERRGNKKKSDLNRETTRQSTLPINSGSLPISTGKEIKFRVGKPRRKRKVKDHVSGEVKRESHAVASSNDFPHEHEQKINQLVSVNRQQYWRPSSPSTSTGSSSRSSSPESPMSYGVTFSSLAQKMSGVLEMYDREFSVVHLTTDIDLNPYRFRNIGSQNSQALLHAVLALSSLHMSRFKNDSQLSISTLDHKHTALRLFREALPNAGTMALTLLDTMVILFSVEAAQSALGPWRLHLAGSYNILEGAGGIRLLSKIPALRPKVAMLLWWDSIVSLVARKPMIFPIKYIKPTFHVSEIDGWCMFDLHGIPETLFFAMVKLDQLHGIFNTAQYQALLEEIEDMVRGWKNDDETFGIPHTISTTDATDQYHLAETWRFGILLYISRVFPRPNGGMNTMSLANITLNHIRCITSETTIRKQVFLPLFLAGSEVSDDNSREFCREYCRFFSGSKGYKDFENSCGYGMFANAGEMLEQIWFERDALADESLWWGDFVDRTTTDVNGLESQFLFG